MEKVSVNLMSDNEVNKVYPSALFLYGTYKEDGLPNFGLFCWFNYCWDSDLAVMACIGGDKLTKDRIRAQRVFSANLVTEELLPLADYLGNTEGYTQGKMDISIDVERGEVLSVPILKKSPWIYELEISHSIPLNESDIFVCKIRNLLVSQELVDNSISANEHIKRAAPVLWYGTGKYFSMNSAILDEVGNWKDFSKRRE